MVVRDAIPALQQFSDALDADVIQNLLSMLEATPVCQGVRADNLLQPGQPRNPLSHLLDNKQSVAVVRSEERRMPLHGTMSDLCSDCKTLKHQLQMKANREEKRTLTRAQPPPKYAPNVILSTPQKLAKVAVLAHEKDASSHKVRQLEDRIAKLTAMNGIDVGEELDAHLASIMDTESV